MANERGRVMTYWVEVCVAGDVPTMRSVLRRHAFDAGLCVTLSPTEFVYSGGMESGAIVRLINYPRFPKEPSVLWATAITVAELLMDACAQKTCSLVAPDATIWLGNPAWVEK